MYSSIQFVSTLNRYYHRKISLFLCLTMLNYFATVGREASFTSGTSQRNLESRGTASRNSRRSSGSKRGSYNDPQARRNDVDVDHMKKVDDWQEMSLPSLAESPINDLTIRPPERLPIFVEVQSLTKGQVFVSILFSLC